MTLEELEIKRTDINGNIEISDEWADEIALKIKDLSFRRFFVEVIQSLCLERYNETLRQKLKDLK